MKICRNPSRISWEADKNHCEEGNYIITKFLLF